MPLGRKIGNVVKIDLFNGYHTYGIEINHGNIAISDVMTSKDVPIDEIAHNPRIFTVGVLDMGFETWAKIGYLELNPSQRRRPDNFIQDPIDLSLKITDDSDALYPASFDEVRSLERVAAWHNFNVEQRVRDHYSGRTNITFEFQRPKPPNAPHFSARTPYIAKPGTIKQIELGDGTFVFGRELENTFYAIYDTRTDDPALPDDVTQRPVLFTTSVSLSARIGWRTVGFSPLSKMEHPLPKRYLRIGSRPTDFLIYSDPYDPNFAGLKGTIEDAKGLEPAIMWDNYQVENRIRAYYQGTSWNLDVV